MHRMRNVFNFVAGNVGKRIKYSNISSQDQSGTLKKDLNLLSMARIIGNYSLISLPLYLIERLEVLVEYYLLKDRR